MNEKMKNQVAEMKKQTIGVEVEMNSIIHVGVGEDRRDHLALFAVRPLDAHVPLELPLAALGIPGRPGVITVISPF